MRTLQGMHAQMNEVVAGLLCLFNDITKKLKDAHDYILKVHYRFPYLISRPSDHQPHPFYLSSILL